VLAFCWYWDETPDDYSRGLAARLARSLCAGIGGNAASAEIDALHFAYRPLRSNPLIVKAWRPVVLSTGRIAAFHGYFDNAPEIATELGVAPNDFAQLYGEAVERWGTDADHRVIGEYCAIIANPISNLVRLARSPLRAPPLHYFHDSHQIAAASVPRALFATGIEQKLNETRVTDSALFNFTEEEPTWFDGIFRVPLGSTVELQRGHPRQLRKYYDVQALPDVWMQNDAAYISRASELLNEGVRASLVGSRVPGSTLSSGLDSPQVAVRALASLPTGQRLPTFTFHPEPGWDEIIDSGLNGNERPMVEAFAAMHPGLEPHFTANEGYEHDHLWNELFHLMGGAPSGLCNMYVMHGIWALARDRGCDLLLLAEWGNYTFSGKGEWAFVEYFIKGRWRQLWLALSHHRNDNRSMLRRFIALSLVPLLPVQLWRLMMRLWHPGKRRELDLVSPLKSEFRSSSGAEERLRNSGFQWGRYQPRNRRHAQNLQFQNSDAESAEVYQAFEQFYGIPQRDPMAYRPFVEFCFGLPVHLFVRDGQMRWLAKEMGKGIMPEEQRINRLNGRWDADWHLRIGRRRKDFLAELDRIEADERLSDMLDVPRLRAALEEFPDKTAIDNQTAMPIEMAVPRGLLTARFINFIEGRNSP
jgi:asparagine synthase (glutamine-hydrolysing)